MYMNVSFGGSADFSLNEIYLVLQGANHYYKTWYTIGIAYKFAILTKSLFEFAQISQKT